MGFCGTRWGIWLLPEWLFFFLFFFSVSWQCHLTKHATHKKESFPLFTSQRALSRADIVFFLTHMFYSVSEPVSYWLLCRLEFSFCFMPLYVCNYRTKKYLLAAFMQLKKRSRLEKKHKDKHLTSDFRAVRVEWQRSLCSHVIVEQEKNDRICFKGPDVCTVCVHYMMCICFISVTWSCGVWDSWQKTFALSDWTQSRSVSRLILKIVHSGVFPVRIYKLQLDWLVILPGTPVVSLILLQILLFFSCSPLTFLCMEYDENVNKYTIIKGLGVHLIFIYAFRVWWFNEKHALWQLFARIGLIQR